MSHASRPVFLDPMKLQMPVGALTSILHRISGILLASGVPFGVYLLDRSLRDEQGFVEVAGLLEHGIVKGLLVALVWALAHHLLAGVRHLLTDFIVGSPLMVARRSAWLVNLGAVGVALLGVGVLL